MPAPAKSHCRGDKATGKSLLVDGELASEETITIKQQAEGCGGWKKLSCYRNSAFQER